METEKNSKSINKKGADFNGNNPKFNETTEKRQNGDSCGIKDHIVTNDGRVFYPCQYCNKVFPMKKSRTLHIKKCPAKDYILSVGDNPVTDEDKDAQKPEITHNIPNAKKSPSKIDIKQNIVLNQQMDVTEILSKSKTPPIKLTIRRSTSNGSETSDHFTVSSSLILKEKNESNGDFNKIAKRLQSNAVRIIKQTKKDHESAANSDEGEHSDDVSETSCQQCSKEFTSQLELLRHSRKCHSYPKVLMALSEVKKFYSMKDRSVCPICHKPLKTNFRSAFVKHLHTHTNEMKHCCHVCNKKFRRMDHMKAHEKRHIIKNEH